MARTHRAELVAYHEAGHAVVAIHHQLPVLRATLGPRGRRHGARVVLAPDWSFHAIQTGLRPAKLGPRRVAHVEKRIACLLAGFSAEVMVTRQWGKAWPAGRPLFLGLGDYDLALKYAWLCGVAPGRRAGFIARLQRPTMEILVSVWPAVAALAAALLKHRTLTVRRMRRIALYAIRGATP
jgi:hypothetical protein